MSVTKSKRKWGLARATALILLLLATHRRQSSSKPTWSVISRPQAITFGGLRTASRKWWATQRTTGYSKICASWIRLSRSWVWWFNLWLRLLVCFNLASSSPYAARPSTNSISLESWIKRTSLRSRTNCKYGYISSERRGRRGRRRIVVQLRIAKWRTARSQSPRRGPPSITVFCIQVGLTRMKSKMSMSTKGLPGR